MKKEESAGLLDYPVMEIKVGKKQSILTPKPLCLGSLVDNDTTF
jgi:hypothetical protein